MLTDKKNYPLLGGHFKLNQIAKLFIAQTKELDGQSTTFKKLLEQLAFKRLGDSKQKSITSKMKLSKIFAV